jgi:hypothetical protein
MTAKNEVCKVDPEQCKTRFDKIDEKLDDIHNRLFVGNGHASLVTRLDRLEQSENGRKKLNLMVVGAVVVVLIETGWSIVTKLGARP